MKGKFITFEGAEGSGKSTQIELLGKYLKERGIKVLLLREPGGVKISEQIREFLLDVKNIAMTKECETLLYLAARSQVVEELILPAMKKGLVVLCDRFQDSTIVYQGHGSGVDIDFIEKTGRFATQGLVPNLTFLFDIDAKKGLDRISRAKDRIERRSLSYHHKVRKGYLEEAQKHPERIKVIKVNGGKEQIHQEIRQYIDEILKPVRSANG